MKLLICMVTHNRLECTKRTFENLLSTINTPYHLIVVDNASSDGTQDYLADEQQFIDQIIFNEDNYFPGKACNIAWEQGLLLYPDTTHLMRVDNDMEFVEGWDIHSNNCFNAFDNLGQLGLDYGALHNCPNSLYDYISDEGIRLSWWPGNIGGTCLIKREIWDKGIRYDETPWFCFKDSRGRVIPTCQEDVKLSLAIQRAGYIFAHITEPLCKTFVGYEEWDKDPEYYLESLSRRGYNHVFVNFFKKHQQEVS